MELEFTAMLVKLSGKSRETLTCKDTFQFQIFRHNVRLLGDHQFTFVDEGLDNQLSLTDESEISFGLEILAEGKVLDINNQLTLEIVDGNLIASTEDGDQQEIEASFMEDGKFHLVVIRNDERGENALIEVSKYSIDDSNSERDFEIMQLNSSIEFRNVFTISPYY